jgi:hypothetical protein
MRANKLMVRRGVQFLLLLGLILACDVSSNAAPQNNQTFTINVYDPRPLASAIQALESRFGWIITYEDPPYVYSGDFEDVTKVVRKDYDPTKPKVLVPRWGAFNFEYTIPAAVREPDELALLQRLLDEYHHSGNPGVFRLVRTGSIFHFVPSESKNSLGVFEVRRSILDANISILDGERRALDMLKAITDAVSQPGGPRVGVGTVPLNLLMQVRIQGGATNEIGRTVLLRTLEATNRKLSWSLFCDAAPVRACALNVYAVDSGPERLK